MTIDSNIYNLQGGRIAAGYDFSRDRTYRSAFCCEEAGLCASFFPAHAIEGRLEDDTTKKKGWRADGAVL